MLLWLKAVLPEYKSKEFRTEDWRDGSLLASLFTYTSGIQLANHDLANVVSVAESTLGIPSIFKPDDLNTFHGEFAFLVYLYFFARHGKQKLLKWVNSLSPCSGHPVQDFQQEWAPGHLVYRIVHCLLPNIACAVNSLADLNADQIAQKALAEAKQVLSISFSLPPSALCLPTTDPLPLIVFLSQLQTMQDKTNLVVLGDKVPDIHDSAHCQVVTPILSQYPIELPVKLKVSSVKAGKGKLTATLTKHLPSTPPNSVSLAPLQQPRCSTLQEDVTAASLQQSYSGTEENVTTASLQQPHYGTQQEDVTAAPLWQPHSGTPQEDVTAASLHSAAPLQQPCCATPHEDITAASQHSASPLQQPRSGTPHEDITAAPLQQPCSGTPHNDVTAASPQQPHTGQVQTNVTVQDLGNNVHEICFTPREMGEHNLFIYWNGTLIPESPAINVTSPSCTVQGRGMEKAFEGLESDFDIIVPCEDITDELNSLSVHIAHQNDTCGGVKSDIKILKDDMDKHHRKFR